ncbi:phage tail protein [Micromonospora endophytica]|uniref:Phage tail protein n=1 Tax=Micromonospora endophytica TaxID=515350 RepID=A0A2W2DCN2_9ACTN|nr:phage tail protein [Micromonospora endophytica]PZF98609.1 phage tail protein [Micromonospora endophytica]RIW40758.1 phage tail protein [Micromonospora endophytica]BCJ56896.1 phage tail protein [Micromonospora endophytica]
MTKDEVAVAIAFVVKIDDQDLGAFNTCDGLGCEVVVEQREEGGNNGHVWQLPTRMKFSNVKLSRPITADSTKLMRWFAGMANGITRKTATIEARTLEGTVIARWGLLDVIPVKWSGPQLNPDSPKVAVETLELAHHGFFGPGSGG